MFLYGWDSLVIPAGFCFSAQERHEFSGFCPTRNRKKTFSKAELLCLLSNYKRESGRNYSLD